MGCAYIMCMKNVNITTIFSDNDPSEIGGPIRVGTVSENVVGVQVCDANRVLVDGLTVTTFANAFAETEEGELDKKYRILWVLESSNIDSSEKIQLVEAMYDTSLNKRARESNKICRSFSNQIFKFTLRGLLLNDYGRYFLKIYLKEKEDDEWQIQSINTINIIREEK